VTSIDYHDYALKIRQSFTVGHIDLPLPPDGATNSQGARPFSQLRLI